ncbi:toxin VasX [Plesiomonas shigelloides]|uniref:toxin VasX n=1 Tax=Plesiomonas shigelloides TaxID=703 RepID=UPI003260FC98
MDQASQEKQGDKEDKVGSSNQGNPNQDALAASNQDCQSPAGVCPYKGLEIALVPVRYALDEPFKAPEKQPHPLPNSHFKGPLKLTGNAYTLRQLRDGWLYVYDESAQQLDEYEVKGDLFINETKGSHGYLLYPLKHTVSIAFSHQRWTERLKKIYSEDEAVAGDAEVSAIRGKALRSKVMRKFELIKFANQGCEHAGNLDLLASHIADLGLPNQGFASTCAPLKAPEGISQGMLWAEKPASTPEAHKAGMPDIKSGMVVALNDLISDMHDLTTRLDDIHVLHEQPFKNDNDRHLWQMAGITQMLALPAIAEIELPAKVRGDQLAIFELQKQLQEYLVTRYQYAMRQGSSNHYIDLGAEQTLSTQHKALKDAGINPEAWGDWQGVRFDNAVNWADLKSFIARYAKEIEALRPRWEATYDDALIAMNALAQSGLLLGVDCETEDAHVFLLACSHQWLLALQFSPDQERTTKLTQHLKHSSLPALAYYGFEADVKAAFEQRTDWTNVGNITAVGNMLGGLEGIASEAKLSDSKIFGLLHEGAKKIVTALKGAITGPAKVVWQHTTELLHPHLLQGAKLGQAIQLLALESVYIAQDVRINKNISNDINTFAREVKNNILVKLQSSTGKTPDNTLFGRMQMAGTEWRDIRWPKLFLMSEDLQAKFEGKMELYLKLQQKGAAGAQAASKVWRDWGHFGGFAALLNITNLIVVLAGYQQNHRAQQGDPQAQLALLRNLVYTAAWTGNAIISVKQGAIALPESLRSMSLDKAMHQNPALTQRFTAMTSWMTGFGTLAAGLEMLETWGKINDDANTEGEEVGYWMKASGLLLQGAPSLASLLRLLQGTRLAIIWSPWMVASIGIGTILYLVATLMLAHYGLLPIERWLKKSSWGVTPDKGWTAIEEFIQYERIVKQPVIKLIGNQLEIKIPDYVQSIAVQGSLRRAHVAQNYPAVYLGKEEALTLRLVKKKPGQCTLALFAHLGDKQQGGNVRPVESGDELTLYIMYPSSESLSGESLRFIARGSLKTNLVITAEVTSGFPVHGIIIGLHA